ncbi:MAG: PEGA domain-containing protein [Deltaproteobacteria bacterium]|nr:PEGA domain-containing protein [Deltaproteobacteria bacterium]
MLLMYGELQDASAAPTTTSSTATPEVAKLHAEAGRTYYQAGKYTEALESFKRALDIAPTAALTFNIARCHERLSDWKHAIEWYERYVALETNARDRAEALDKIELLKRQLGPDASTPEGRYEARLQAGRAAYSKGDYETAIEEFKAAFDAVAKSAALYNVAKCYEKMGRYEEGIDYFQQYLELDPNAPDRPDVENTIKRLKKSIMERYQELTVNSNPPGAEIYLDDRNQGLQGQTNFRFKVTPGPHTLFLDLNGYEPIKREFVMPDDKPLALDFEMKELQNVGYATINVDKEGARIFVDGAIVGLSPFRQKKALSAGPHQVTVELAGYERWNEIIIVTKDGTNAVDVRLEKYSAPVSDETLSAWGRNLMLIGIVGGALGVAGPFAYQKLVIKKDLYGDLASRTPGEIYRGPDSKNLRDNSELNTLKKIQTWSIVGGAVFAAGGLTFYCIKWFRPEPTPPVSADALHRDRNDTAWVRLTGLTLAPTADGAGLGLTGSF